MTTAIAGQLSVDDRCDRCGAQAYFQVHLSAGGDLLFCAHHYQKHAGALDGQIADVVDESHRLTS